MHKPSCVDSALASCRISQQGRCQPVVAACCRAFKAVSTIWETPRRPISGRDLPTSGNFCHSSAPVNSAPGGNQQVAQDVQAGLELEGAGWLRDEWAAVEFTDGPE